jgi:glucose-1-phosphate adenylyltransferase
MGIDHRLADSGDEMHGVTAVLLAGGRGSRMHELTEREAKPAIFFGTSQRIIDFTMANAVGSAVPRLIVATQYRPETLHAYLPQRWDGFFGPACLTLREGRAATGSAEGYGGTADAVHANAAEIDAAGTRDVIVLAGDHVYQMDYRAIIAAHRASGAKVTVAATTVPIKEAGAFGVINTGAAGRIEGFFEKPDVLPYRPDQSLRALVSMGIYVFDWAWLRTMLREDQASATSVHDFGSDILTRAVMEGVAHVWRHQDDGKDLYWSDVGTLDNYRLAQLDFEQAARPFCLSTLAATQRLAGEPSELNDGMHFGFALSVGGLSLRAPRHRPDVANRWTVLSESVLMPGARLAAGVRLTKAIVAPRTSIPAGIVVGEDPEEDARWFRRTEGGTVLITTAMIAKRGLNRPRTYPATTPGWRLRASARP